MSASPRQDRILIAGPRPGSDAFGPHIEHTSSNRCPVCDKTRCITFQDGGTICRREPSDRPTGAGWYHETAPPDGAHPAIHVIDPQPGADRLPPEELDAVNRHLLSLLPLDGGTSFDDEHIGFRRATPHRDGLYRRGRSDAQITARGFATYTATGRPAIAGALIARHGQEIVGRFPGLHLGREGHVAGRYATLAGPAGLITPITDVERRVAGLNILRDEPGNGGKYQILSSNPARGYVGGCSSGNPLNVAYPLGPRPDPDPAPSWPLGAPGVTEGVIKSIVASDELGETILGMPGISGRRDVVATLRRLGADQVVIALDRDADPKTAAAVTRAENALARELMLAGIAPLLASWDTSSADGEHLKGLDDALVAGAEISVTPFPAERLKIRSGDIVETDPPPTRPKPLRSVDEARAALARRLREVLERPISNPPRSVQVSAGTGVGKTRAVAELLTAWQRDGWPHKTVMKRGVPVAEPIRVLFLAPTKELCAEVFALLPPGLAILQEGRNPDAQHPWGCLEPERIALAGAGRHNPHADVCSTCSLINGWEPGFPECNYLRSKAVAEGARVVVAPDDSYFNGSSELRKFDVVIGDEVLFPYLIENILVDQRRVAEWRERMNRIDAAQPLLIDHRGEETIDARYPLNSPFRRLVDTLDMVQARRPSGGSRWIRALPALRDICPDLDEVVAAILEIDPGEQTGRYPCETPEIWESDDRQLVPLRALHHLAEAIAAELDRHESADTRLWLTADGLLFLRPRQHAIDLLRRPRVINLDATPHPALRFFLPDPEVIEIDAPLRQHVTQTTDVLGTAKELAGIGNTNLAHLKMALETVTTGAGHPVIFTRKAFAPEGADESDLVLKVSNDQADYGWFDNQTRGLNRYQHADVLVAVGRYSHPIDRLRAEVMAARFSPDPAPEGERLELLLFDWRDSNGRGKGRWTRADADPDVNAAVRWSESSSILQAIGRGRGVNHAVDDPLQVYVLSNLPIAGLTVDRLVTLEELGADPPRRKTPPGFYDQRDAQNAAREAETRAKVVSALAAIQEDGAPITFSEVARRSGVSRERFSRNATLKSLVQQVQGCANAARCEPVTPSWDNDSSISAQEVTGSHPQKTHQGPLRSAPDITPVREALGAADRARLRENLHRANTDLAARLADIARARGRDPVPKPRAISPESAISRVRMGEP